VRRDGTVPVWPHFVLGARDPIAPYALRSYARYAAEHGFDNDYVESVYRLADEFDEYRAGHGNGDPEAGPHRQDNPDVVAAMEGRHSMIYVRPDK
jgi:hypothetical protein